MLILNHQNTYRLRLRELECLSMEVLRLLSREWPPSLSGLEINFVSARESGRLHQQYLHDPSPTDVITFDTPPLGLLVICPEIAHGQKKIEGLSLHRELLTYIIHGCLHLCGMDDQTDAGFEAMRRRQTEILREATRSR